MSGDNQSLKIEYGDFQTPIEFTHIVCDYLREIITHNPSAILEPTCGIGNFLVASEGKFTPTKLFGIEKNTEYYEFAKSRFQDNAELYNEDLFFFDLEKIRCQVNTENLLIIGNPPWVSNSVLSSLDSNNLPEKRNFKQLKGLDAITGSSNFDISEYMFLQLVDAFANTNTTIALLCKTIVARNVFEELKRNEIANSKCTMALFDAKKVFDVSVDACLFIIELSNENIRNDKCDVYNIDEPSTLLSSFGYINNKFYSSLDDIGIDIDGKCTYEWRQGVKHDCSKVMELTSGNDCYINGNKESVNIEDLYVFPLLKSSHIKKPILQEFKKQVIVTQKKARADTSEIRNAAPMTWAYLNDNMLSFDKRKSSIYKNSPPFSMFGVGDYSYAQYKVGISGFYKTPLFVLSYSEKPVMFDDTCYFLSFDSYEIAYTCMLFLNSKIVQTFLKSIAFIDSKRPYTKKILERIDFVKASRYITLSDLEATEKLLNILPVVNKSMMDMFLNDIGANHE